MVKYSETHKLSQPNQGIMIEQAGKMLAEAFHADGQTEVLKENYGITFKEAGQTTTTNSGSYANLLAKTLYTAAANQIEKVVDLITSLGSLYGVNDIKDVGAIVSVRNTKSV